MSTSKSPSVLLTGATGFIGKRLLYNLDAKGWRVRCLVRPQERLDPAIALNHEPEVVYGDLLDPASLEKALDGMDTAYYLVHSMGGRSLREMRSFEERDRTAAVPAGLLSAGEISLHPAAFPGDAQVGFHPVFRRCIDILLCFFHQFHGPRWTGRYTQAAADAAV